MGRRSVRLLLNLMGLHRPAASADFRASSASSEVLLALLSKGRAASRADSTTFYYLLDLLGSGLTSLVVTLALQLRQDFV